MLINLIHDVVFEDEGEEPITLEQAKNWLKVEQAFTADDDIITSLITVARQQCEGYLKISLIEKTVTASLQNEANDIELPYGPVLEFTSLTDADGNEIDSANYTVRGLKFKRLNYFSQSFQSDYQSALRNGYDVHRGELTALYDAGYAAEDLPEHFKSGIKAQLAYLYQNRGDEVKMAQLSPMVTATLKAYRRVV